jgi:hypothetical protein
VSENPPEQEERILQRGADETGSFLPGNWGWEILVVVGFSYWVAMALGVQTLMWGLGLEPVEGAPPVDGRLLFGSAFAQIFGALVTVKIAQLMDPERWRQRLGIGRKPLVDFARGLVWYVPIGLTVWLGIYVYTAIYQHWIHADGLEQQYVAQLASDPELGPLLVRLASLGLQARARTRGLSPPSWPSPDGVARPQRAFGPFFGGRATPTGEGQDDGLRRPDLRWGRCAVWRWAALFACCWWGVCSLAGGRILSGYLLIRGMLCAAISLRNLGRSRNT